MNITNFTFVKTKNTTRTLYSVSDLRSDGSNVGVGGGGMITQPLEISYNPDISWH